MALNLATVGQKITATFINLIIAQVNKQGTTSVIPTSVSGTGVTLGSNGKVSFTASSTITVNGCFTSNFDNYMLVLRFTNKSTNSTLLARLRSAGTDDTSSNYNHGRTFSYSGTAVALNTLAGSAFAVDSSAVAANAHGKFDMIIDSPALAVPTIHSTKYSTAIGNTFLADGSSSGSHSLSTAYDGITIYPDIAGNVTGTLRIYGFNNNT